MTSLLHTQTSNRLWVVAKYVIMGRRSRAHLNTYVMCQSEVLQGIFGSSIEGFKTLLISWPGDNFEA